MDIRPKPLTRDQIRAIERSAYLAALVRARDDFPKNRLAAEEQASFEAVVTDLAIKHAFPEQVDEIIAISFEVVEELKHEEFIHCVRGEADANVPEGDAT